MEARYRTSPSNRRKVRQRPERELSFSTVHPFPSQGDGQGPGRCVPRRAGAAESAGPLALPLVEGGGSWSLGQSSGLVMDLGGLLAQRRLEPAGVVGAEQ